MRQPPDIFYGVDADRTELRDLLTQPFTRVTLSRYFQLNIEGNSLWKLVEAGLLRLRSDIPPMLFTKEREPASGLSKAPLFIFVSSNQERCIWYEIVEEHREAAIAQIQMFDAMHRLT